MANNEKRPINWRTFGICIILALGQYVAAYQTVIIGTTMGKKDFMHTVGLWDTEGKEVYNYDSLVGAVIGLYQVSFHAIFDGSLQLDLFISSSLQAGAVFGCIFGALVADKWGRKLASAFGAVVTIIGLAGLTGSVNMPMFLVFRAITGIGTWAQATVGESTCWPKTILLIKVQSRHT